MCVDQFSIWKKKKNSSGLKKFLTLTWQRNNIFERTEERLGQNIDKTIKDENILTLIQLFFYGFLFQSLYL